MNDECPGTAGSENECKDYGQYYTFTGTEFQYSTWAWDCERWSTVDCGNFVCFVSGIKCYIGKKTDEEWNKYCVWKAGNGICSESCWAVKTKTECGTGCQWKDPGTCAKEEKDVEEESDSDSSNYVKFLNYLLVLFLFIF